MPGINGTPRGLQAPSFHTCTVIHDANCTLMPKTSMNLLQWVLGFLRRLYHTRPVRLSIRSLLALCSFLLGPRFGRRAPGKNEASILSPDLPGTEKIIPAHPSVAALPCKPLETIPSISICASLLPHTSLDTNTLHPYPFSSPNASASSQDIRPSSLHSVNIQSSSRQLYRVSRSNWSGDMSRSRSNPRINFPTVSGYPGGSGSATRLSTSRPNSVHSHPYGSRPPSFNGQLSVSRPISDYSGSQLSIPPSITIDQGPDGADTTPMHMSSMHISQSPVQEEPPFLPTETTRDSLKISKAYEKFRPISPNEHPRYERETYIANEDTTFELAPLTFCFQTEETSPFQRLMHPEGACYYVYHNKRYYTDGDIRDNLMKEHVISCINDFDDFIRARSIQLSDRVNVVFSIRPDDDDPAKYTCDYYIADHTTQSVFWLDVFDASWLHSWPEVKGVTSLTHIEHAIVTEYWYHCHLFPHSYNLTVEAVDELRDIISHCICDSLTSSTSTVPYNITDLNEMMLLMNNLRKNPSTGGGVSAYSRIMCIFARQRFLNLHGQPAARLDRDRSVYHPADKVHKRPWLMRCMSPALFSAPDLYYRQLSKLYVDGLVHESSWADFVMKMNDEWQQLILFNTVLLNANVAFLAIQSIDNFSSHPGRSPAQIASFLSIVASFGSIILGLVLARKHRAKAKDTAADAARFLNSWMRNRLGLATLAILYSVPYALLMWGVFGFLVAFSFMCYSSSDAVVISLMSSAWFVVAFLVLWCVTALASWDQRLNEPKSFWEVVHSFLSIMLFGLWWLVESSIDMMIQGFGLMLSQSKKTQKKNQRPGEMQRNRRKSSMGTVVVEMWRKSSLFNRSNDRKDTGDTGDTDETAV